MQTEEVVPRAQSAGIDGCISEKNAFQHHLHLLPRIKCPLPTLLHMAVKQEPQDDDERTRHPNAHSPQTDADTGPTSIDNQHSHDHHSAHHDIQGLKGNQGQTIADANCRGKASRGRRKSRWKLKFHHQALPPEYLDHYEASLAQEAVNSSASEAPEPIAPSPAPTSSTSSPSPVADVQTWLQRIAAMQQELCPPGSALAHQQHCQTHGNPQLLNPRRSVITSTYNPAHQNNGNPGQTQPHTPTRPPMKYSDLPYMGEITLDNSKPRRGRKPKKADICHLIYKNYGTILPGTPGHEDGKLLPREKVDCREAMLPVQAPFQRTDVQNRISSLLEKRLTQESRRNLILAESPKEQDEPLNLCVRDLNQLKIRLLRKHGNVYEAGQAKSEASSDGEEVECLGVNFHGENPSRQLEASGAFNGAALGGENNNAIEPVVGNNPGFIYWPNAGVFIHPMALQSQLLSYQRLAQGEKCLAARGTEPREHKIVPKSIYSMMETKSGGNNCSDNGGAGILSAGVASTCASAMTTVPAAALSPRSKRNAPAHQQHGQQGQQGQQGQPTKRKRSAIFIPPMPTENNNNPATEVSICKFKFTGGAKPSLQEKKSLSVDSGGNFRYYSGTGDKSMRGYEFFPREALQQPPGQAGSSAGAFLNAAAERIQPALCQRTASVAEDGRRKRKTRKSLQREKLEQTFKEKGFLIQTQQLESAEGATYCKFRQLRKFTRYLFRSWKDYLPGNVRELTGNHEAQVVNGDVENDASVARSPIPLGNVDLAPGFVDDPRTLPLT